MITTNCMDLLSRQIFAILAISFAALSPVVIYASHYPLECPFSISIVI